MTKYRLKDNEWNAVCKNNRVWNNVKVLRVSVNPGSMPPVLGGAAMAVLPASPQTATQGNHPQVQTQLLGASTQSQPQLLYQPYNLMPGGGGGGGGGGGPGQAAAYQHHHISVQQSNFIPDSTSSNNTLSL